MKATFTSHPEVPGDYTVIHGRIDGGDYIAFICPCGVCTEPVVYYDMSGINWPGPDEFQTVFKTVACPEARWNGQLDSVVGDFING